MTTIVVFDVGTDIVTSFDVMHHQQLIVYTQHDRVIMLRGHE